MADSTFIYALLDPVSSEVRYIGQAHNPRRRLVRHLSEARSGHRPTRKNGWVRGLLNSGETPLLRVLQEVDVAAVDACEIGWIKAFGRQDLQEGLLTNSADGGSTCRGRVVSDEVRKQIAATLQGQAFTEERRRNISDGLRRRGPRTEAEKAKISATMQGRVKGQQHRQRLSDSLQGHTVSPETRAKLSASIKRRWADGSTFTFAHLTAEQAAEIRARATGAYGEGRAFAREYGVTPAVIYGVLSDRRRRPR